MDISRLYAKFRISPAFLLLLLAFVTTSIVAHHIVGYDHDWTITNFVLSAEASLSVCVFMKDSANFESYVRSQQQMHADNLKRIELIATTGQQQLEMTLKLVEQAHVLARNSDLGGAEGQGMGRSNLEAPAAAQK